MSNLYALFLKYPSYEGFTSSHLHPLQQYRKETSEEDFNFLIFFFKKLIIHMIKPLNHNGVGMIVRTRMFEKTSGGYCLCAFCSYWKIIKKQAR